MTSRKAPARFTFGIPLLPRVAAQDWNAVEALLDLTLSSVSAQTDQDFAVLLVGHDRPAILRDHPGCEFVRADWPSDVPDMHNNDAGRKKDLINRIVRSRGGGLLMMLDADDWTDRRLVEAARAGITPDHAGGLIESGVAVDMETLAMAALPERRVFDGGFFRLCGSCAVMNLQPHGDGPLVRDPYTVLCDHYRWPEAAAENSLSLASLDAAGCYLVNTSSSHSENHGPFASWRRRFNAAVNAHGRPLDEETAYGFGLSLDAISRVSSRAPSAEDPYPGAERFPSSNISGFEAG